VVGAADIEKRAQQRLAQAAAAMRRGDGDFVDPQLRRLVGMEVVDAGGEADDEGRDAARFGGSGGGRVDGDGDVVVRVGEEFCGEGWVDGIVDELRGDVGEDEVVTGAEDFDFDFGWHGSSFCLRAADSLTRLLGKGNGGFVARHGLSG
jgi:hypothetical protein